MNELPELAITQPTAIFRVETKQTTIAAIVNELRTQNAKLLDADLERLIAL